MILIASSNIRGNKINKPDRSGLLRWCGDETDEDAVVVESRCLRFYRISCKVQTWPCKPYQIQENHLHEISSVHCVENGSLDQV